MAAVANREVYGQDLEKTFPKLKGINRLEGGKLELSFDKNASALKVTKGEIHGFELAGADGDFTKAKAVVIGAYKIVVSSKLEDVSYIRYAYEPFPSPKVKVFAESGFPLGPFVEKL